jgi:hypothetical protein
MLWGFVVMVGAALSTVWHFWPRYIASFLPFLALWAAHGIDAALRCPRPSPRWARIAAVCVVGIFASAYATQARVPVSFVEREAGLFLREKSFAEDVSGRPKVMEVTDLVSYYSGGVWRPLPYSDADTALRYIARVHPDYVVVSAMNRQMLPYLTDWSAHGIPSPAFTRVLNLHPGEGDALAVYRYMF